MNPSTSALDGCLSLLRGPGDDQKLAGLLIAAKLLSASSAPSDILAVYSAAGPRFLHRLLITGMGKGEDREAYLKLAVTMLAAFCRIEEIAATEEMVEKVPVVAKIIANSSDPSLFQECYEFLLLVAVASEKGISRFHEPGVLEVLSPHISALQDGSQSLEHAVRILQLVLKNLPHPMTNSIYLSGLSHMVASLARQFAVLQNALKFDVLHLLTSLLSSGNTPFYDALRSMSSETWAAYIRVGIADVLRNRVVSKEKLQALLLAESIMSICGEEWLLEQYKLHDVQDSLPVDKYLLLILESSRVEVDVLLNELGYLKYDPSKSSSTSPEAVLLKQHELAVSFSLIEKITKLVSRDSTMEGNRISESTLMTVVMGLDKTINIVLDFLQDSKEHGEKRGNDLLAAVRVIGSCLAEMPCACKGRTPDLLEYMLSIEGEDESSPFYSVCFLLPMLCQITMESEGCQAVASFGGHRTIADCLVKLITQNDAGVEDNGVIFLACDTILNILLNGKQIRAHQEGSHFVNLLQALALWAGSSSDLSNVMMASSICSLVFDLTTEDSLLKQDNLGFSSLQILSEIIARSLNQRREDLQEQTDLHQLIVEGYTRWAARFPTVRNAVGQAKFRLTSSG